MEDQGNNGSLVGYTCPDCSFDTDFKNCDDCEALVKWDNSIGGSAHGAGCGTYIGRITCRNCGYKFDL
jgi:hypothetical protein